MESVDVNVGCNGVALRLGVRQPGLRCGTADTVVMNAGAAFAKGAGLKRQNERRG